MTIERQTNAFPALTEISELLEGAWTETRSDNHIVRAFMISTGTLMAHGRQIDGALLDARARLVPLFQPEVTATFGKADPIGALVEINALVDGTWNELSADNYLVQAFMRSTEALLEAGALMGDGIIVRRYEDMKSTFSASPSP